MTAPADGIECRPMGDRAVLLDLTAAIADAGVDGPALPSVVAAALRQLMRDGSDEVSDVVPAAATVLVRSPSGPGSAPPAAGADDRMVAHAAAAVSQFRRRGPASDDDATAELVVPVRYDGPDLDDVAAMTGLAVAEVVAAHTGTVWTAAFVGFAPGFAYLTGGDPRLQVPRRGQSRTSVPAGSVALAGEYSAVYPRASPGGWQLIGSTDLELWDESANPAARIRPGQRVRFVQATAQTATMSSAGAETVSPAEALATTDGPALVVIRPGPLSLVQDAGRRGRAADGVGPSGPADRNAHARANLLVGNDPGAAAIECTLGGLTVRAEGADLLVAVCGAPTPATVDGAGAPLGETFTLPAGAILRLRTPRTGVRSYLAVAGSLAVKGVLGSASTDTLAGLGPAPLAAGTRLPVGPAPAAPAPGAGTAGPDSSADETPTLRARFGPRDDWFTDPAALLRGEWVVSPQSSRVGLRLDRPSDPQTGEAAPAVARSRADELPSEGLVRGAIQVPPGGQPVLFLADHPLTGGYPVIAVVLDADVDRAGQLRPGQRLRFTAHRPSGG